MEMKLAKYNEPPEDADRPAPLLRLLLRQVPPDVLLDDNGALTLPENGVIVITSDVTKTAMANKTLTRGYQ